MARMKATNRNHPQPSVLRQASSAAITAQKSAHARIQSSQLMLHPHVHHGRQRSRSCCLPRIPGAVQFVFGDCDISALADDRRLAAKPANGFEVFGA
jgi:hypothetical protein